MADLDRPFASGVENSFANGSNQQRTIRRVARSAVTPIALKEEVRLSCPAAARRASKKWPCRQKRVGQDHAIAKTRSTL